MGQSHPENFLLQSVKTSEKYDQGWGVVETTAQISRDIIEARRFHNKDSVASIASKQNSDNLKLLRLKYL